MTLPSAASTSSALPSGPGTSCSTSSWPASSGGSYVLAALLRLAGDRSRRGRRPGGVSTSRFPAMVICPVLLTLDLGQAAAVLAHAGQQRAPWRPIFKYWSPMSVGAWVLVIFGVFVDGLVRRGPRARRPPPAPAGAAGRERAQRRLRAALHDRRRRARPLHRRLHRRPARRSATSRSGATPGRWAACSSPPGSARRRRRSRSSRGTGGTRAPPPTSCRRPTATSSSWSWSCSPSSS